MLFSHLKTAVGSTPIGFWSIVGRPTKRGDIDRVPLTGEGNHIMVDKTLSYIREAIELGKPFYINLWFHTPHTPFGSTPEYMGIYKNNANIKEKYRAIYADITAMDHAMGELRKGLRDLRVADNTFLCFCGDNGGILPTNQGLKGSKGGITEGGLRVPGLVEWPSVIKTPFRTPYPAGTVDLVPTIADILNLDNPYPVKPVDGLSMLPMLQGETSTRSRPLFFHRNGSGDKYVASSDWVNLSVDGRYRYMRSKGDKQLYDLFEDPTEKRNLIDQMPELAKKNG